MEKKFAGDRRSFLKGAAIFGGTAMTLLLGYRRLEASPVNNAPAPHKSADAGYRLTEHIKKYYETASF